jgi:hypothetical protein
MGDAFPLLWILVFAEEKDGEWENEDGKEKGSSDGS